MLQLDGERRAIHRFQKTASELTVDRHPGADDLVGLWVVEPCSDELPVIRRNRSPASGGISIRTNETGFQVFRLEEKCASTKWSISSWLAASTCSNWTPMPTRRSLQATRAFRVDVALRAGHAEAHPDRRAGVERARGPDRDAAVAEIECQRRGDGVAEPILDRNAEHHARTASPVEVVRKQVRRQRRQNVLRGAVLVHVTATPQRARDRGPRRRSRSCR